MGLVTSTSPDHSARPAPRPRCCARCRTQFAISGGLMCADAKCKCHRKKAA